MRRTTIIAALAATGLLLAGCGGSQDTEDTATGGEEPAAAGSSETTDAPEPAEPAGFDPATATLPATFDCASIDKAAVADALGIPVGAVKVTASREVGEKYVPFPGAKRTKSTSNLCELGRKGDYVGVLTMPGVPSTVMEGITKDAIAQFAKPVPADAYGTRCEASEQTAFGALGMLAACTNGAADKPSTTYALGTGLVGGEPGTRFVCQLGHDGGKVVAADLVEPMQSVCLALLEDLAAT